MTVTISVQPVITAATGILVLVELIKHNTTWHMVQSQAVQHVRRVTTVQRVQAARHHVVAATSSQVRARHLVQRYRAVITQPVALRPQHVQAKPSARRVTIVAVV